MPEIVVNLLLPEWEWNSPEDGRAKRWNESEPSWHSWITKITRRVFPTSRLLWEIITTVLCLSYVEKSCLLLAALNILTETQAILEQRLESGMINQAWRKVKVLVTQSRLTLCDPMDCGPPVSSVHGIIQTRILGVGCHSCQVGIFLTQGSPGYPALQADSIPSELPWKP